MKLDQVFTGSK